MNEIMHLDTLRHPCFNASAKGHYGRVHLPVAPQCNIKCNFCDRRYDCVNESRPGVTSALLSPDQAVRYLDRVREQEPRISVAGIAGPGDPFASGDSTMAVLRSVRQKHSDLLLCLSSNGMGIGPFIDELAEIGVSHVTITVCAVDPEIGSMVYAWVKDGNVVYRGRQAAELLLNRQRDAIARLKDHAITVKVNSIVIPGVNDRHIEAIAKQMKEMRVDLMNCMALFPNAGTVFGSIKQPDKETMNAIREKAEAYLPQMRHCTRCRADAVGLLGDDRAHEFRSCLRAVETPAGSGNEPRPYIAVASTEGILINQHLGEARSLSIWEQHDSGPKKIADREMPEPGGGIKRWHQLAGILKDCRAVLVSGIGPTPSEILRQSGIVPVEAAGFIEDGLIEVFTGKDLSRLRGRRLPVASAGCNGGGGGCG